MNVDVNWEDPTLQRWLNTITQKGTRHQYRNTWQTYVDFTGMQATPLIQEAMADQQRPILEQQDIVKQRLLDYYHWNINEAPRYKGGGGNIILGHGVKSKTAAARVAAIRSFYSTFNITVRLKGRSRLPKPQVQNPRLIVGAEQVRVLLQYTNNPRDRAIILTIFQGGMDVSTLCSLDYRHVNAGLESEEYPLQLTLRREKTGLDYYTFLGRDSIDAIHVYLRDMQSKGIIFTPTTPLFIKAVYTGPPQRITTHLVQKILRDVAQRSPLVTDENNGHDFNPLSPHALRESFGSIMSNKGVSDTIVDFWLGHSIGEMAEAYKRVQADELRRMYKEREIFLSVGAPDTEIEQRLKVQIADEKAKLEHQFRQQFQASKDELQSLVNRLSTDNMALRDEVRQLHASLATTRTELYQIKEEIEFKLEQERKSQHAFLRHLAKQYNATD